MMVVVVFTDIAFVEAVSVIVEPDGARSGTRSQAETTSASAVAANPTMQRRAIMKVCNILLSMHLHGQAEGFFLGARRYCRRDGPREAGYAMVALLVSMSVMAVMLTMAMPAWNTLAKREKEAELIFRGQQYARAIELFSRRYPGALPPNLDVLVQQKFLRKKFKDPITGKDFEPVRLDASGAVPGAVPSQEPGGRGGTSPRGSAAPPRPAQSSARGGSMAPAGGGAVVGIVGVVSSSTDTSLRLFNGRSKYTEWIFQYTARTQTPGAGGVPGTAAPGLRGGQPQQGPGSPGIGRSPQPGGRGGTDLPSGRGGPGGPARGGGPMFPPPQPTRPPR
jgi:type II secretory pathway pseudopilin PulG